MDNNIDNLYSNPNNVEFELIRESIKNFFIENKYLNQDNINYFIDYIGFKNIINSDEECNSMLKYLLDYQFEFKEKLAIDSNNLVKENIDLTEVEKEYINNDNTHVTLTSCLYAFDEIFNYKCEDIEIDLNNKDMHNSVKFKKKLSKELSSKNLKIKDSKEDINTLNLEGNNTALESIINNPVIVTPEILYNIKKLFELIFSDNFDFNYNMPIESKDKNNINKDLNIESNINSFNVIKEERVYSLPDIAIILNNHPYLNTSCYEVKIVLLKLFNNKLDYNNNICFEVYNKLIDQINKELDANNIEDKIIEEDDNNIEDLDIDEFNHSYNVNELNLNNQESIASNLKSNKRNSNKFKIINQFKKINNNNIDKNNKRNLEEILKYDQSNVNIDTNNFYYKSFESLDEDIKTIKEEDKKLVYDFILILEVAQYMRFTIKNQIINDLDKLTNNNYGEYDDYNSVLESINNNIKSLTIKSNDIESFITEVIKKYRKKKKDIANFNKKFSILETESKNLCTVMSCYESVLSNIDEKQINKINNITNKDDQINKLSEDMSNLISENNNLKEKIKMLSTLYDEKVLELTKQEHYIKDIKINFEKCKNDLNLKIDNLNKENNELKQNNLKLKEKESLFLKNINENFTIKNKSDKKIRFVNQNESREIDKRVLHYTDNSNSSMTKHLYNNTDNNCFNLSNFVTNTEYITSKIKDIENNVVLEGSNHFNSDFKVNEINKIEEKVILDNVNTHNLNILCENIEIDSQSNNNINFNIEESINSIVKKLDLSNININEKLSVKTSKLNKLNSKSFNLSKLSPHVDDKINIKKHKDRINTHRRITSYIYDKNSEIRKMSSNQLINYCFDLENKFSSCMTLIESKQNILNEKNEELKLLNQNIEELKINLHVSKSDYENIVNKYEDIKREFDIINNNNYNNNNKIPDNNNNNIESINNNLKSEIFNKQTFNENLLLCKLDNFSINNTYEDRIKLFVVKDLYIDNNINISISYKINNNYINKIFINTNNSFSYTTNKQNLNNRNFSISCLNSFSILSNEYKNLSRKNTYISKSNVFSNLYSPKKFKLLDTKITKTYSNLKKQNSYNIDFNSNIIQKPFCISSDIVDANNIKNNAQSPYKNCINILNTINKNTYNVSLANKTESNNSDNYNSLRYFDNNIKNNLNSLKTINNNEDMFFNIDIDCKNNLTKGNYLRNSNHAFTQLNPVESKTVIVNKCKDNSNRKNSKNSIFSFTKDKSNNFTYIKGIKSNKKFIEEIHSRVKNQNTKLKNIAGRNSTIIYNSNNNYNIKSCSKNKDNNNNLNKNSIPKKTSFDSNRIISNKLLNLNNKDKYFDEQINNTNLTISENIISTTEKKDKLDQSYILNTENNSNLSKSPNMLITNNSNNLTLMNKNFDIINLKNIPFILNFLINCNEDIEYIYTSNIIHYLNLNKSISKKILITKKSIYILNHSDNYITNKYQLNNLNQLSISTKNLNLLVFHFKNSVDDLIIEDLHRSDLLNYFKFIYNDNKLNLENENMNKYNVITTSDSNLIEYNNNRNNYQHSAKSKFRRLSNKSIDKSNKNLISSYNSTKPNFKESKKIIKLSWMSNIKVKLNGDIVNLINKKNYDMFTLSNYEGCKKFGYLKQKSKNFFVKNFTEKFVCLSNVGLIIFNNPRSQPSQFIALDNCTIDILSYKDNNDLDRKYSIIENTIKDSNKTNTYDIDNISRKESLFSNINKLEKIEDNYVYISNPNRIIFEIRKEDKLISLFKAPNKNEADSWVYELKKFVFEIEKRIKFNFSQFIIH